MRASLTVYRASAGSGKTFTLAAKYIALLLRGTNNYRNTLAVTFTNKATAEMKSRILEQLLGIWKADPKSEDFFSTVRKELKDDPIAGNIQVLRNRAGEALVTILHDYSRFRVQTIDSFFQTVLKNLAHELDLTANLQTDLDDTQALSSAVDHILEQMEQNEMLRNWVYDFVQERIDSDKSWNVTTEIKQFGKAIFKDKYLKNSQHLTEILRNNGDVKNYRSGLNELKKHALDQLKECLGKMHSCLETCNIDFAAFNNGRYVNTYLVTLENVVSSKIATSDAKFNSFPSATVQNYIEDTSHWLRKADIKNTSLINAIEDSLRPMLMKLEDTRLNVFRVVNSVDLTLQKLNPLRLLNAIDEEVTSIMNEANRFLLAKTPILLSSLIKDSDAPFVFERMGTLLNHVMIDEFQDTSVMQWNNFKSLLLDMMSKSDGNLIVGDVKQSIYRWRGGDWSLLQNIGKDVNGGTLDIQTLDTNYRSERRIINFNNELFKNIIPLMDNLDEEKLQTFAKAYSDVEQHWPEKKAEKGFIDVKLYSKKEENAELAMLHDMQISIASFHSKGLSYNDMAILIRKNDSATPIMDYFAENMPEVHFVSDEAFKLSSSEAVNMLIAAMHCLCEDECPVEKTYLSSHCQCRPQINANNEIADQNKLSPDWNSILLKEERDIFLPDEFRVRRDELMMKPLYELQEELIRIFGISEMRGQEAYLFTYLDNVMQFTKDNNPTLPAFLKFWESKLKDVCIPATKVDGIRILTIHKSKGLQFHTVLMPYCNWPLEEDRLSDILWCEPAVEPFNELPLVPIQSKSSAAQSIYANDYSEEHRLRRVENINLLYVANTRAEKNLLIWGIESGDNKQGKITMTTIADVLKNTLPMDLNTVSADETLQGNENDASHKVSSECLPSVHFHYGEPIYDLKSYKTSMPALDVAMQSFPCTAEFRQSNPSQEFIKHINDSEESDNDYIQQGLLLHRLFSTIRTREEVEQVLQQFESDGLLGSILTRKKLKDLIERGMRNKKVADWFDPHWTVSNECSIVSIDPTTNELCTRRPDRVLVSENNVTVIDFKFGKPKPEHGKQVSEYMKLLSEMNPTKKIEGYLWYVYNNNIEEV